MYLSRKDIAGIAGRVIQRYNILSPPKHSDIRRIDPVKIATEIFGLTVKYMKLSSDGSILGITSYDATFVEVTGSAPISQSIILDGRTILVEQSLCTAAQQGRHNFTVAHELGHQVLRLLYPDDYGIRYRKTGVVYYRDKSKRQAIPMIFFMRMVYH